MYQVPFRKRGLLLKERICSQGEKFFPSRLVHLLERGGGGKNNFNRAPLPKKCLHPHKRVIKYCSRPQFHFLFQEKNQVWYVRMMIHMNYQTFFFSEKKKKKTKKKKQKKTLNKTYVKMVLLLLWLVLKERVNLSSLLTNINTFANSADPDKRAFSSGSTLFVILLLILIEIPICNNECVQIQRWKRPFQKHGAESIKSKIIVTASGFLYWNHNTLLSCQGDPDILLIIFLLLLFLGFLHLTVGG